jgi:hypothetical protein
MRFSNFPSLRPPARLAETLYTAGFSALVRNGPPTAGFRATQPPAPAALRGAPRGSPASPRFKIEALTTGFTIAIGGNSRLAQAKFLAEPQAAPRSASDRIRFSEVDTRWKALSTALPERPAGRIVAVMGSLLERPVRLAVPGEAPAIFEIPLRPVSFPQMALRMASLADRLHRTDRIGFTPP